MIVRYLIGFHRCAAQVMNNMRVGKVGKRANCDGQWRNLEKVWFRKTEEDGVSSFARRMTQGIFVGHHGRAGAVLCVSKNGVVRGKSWTRQTLCDAWGATNSDGLCDTPWQMVALEWKLTKKVTADKEGDATIAKDAPSTSSSSSVHVSLECLVSGEKQDLLEPVLVQKSGHVDDDIQFFRVGCILRDGWTKESLHRRSAGLVPR